MKWFGENWGAPACEPDARVATPVGALCTWCEEAIEEKDCGVLVPHISVEEPPEDKPVHLECQMRQVLGSVGHQMKRCSCFGGQGSGDNPHLSLRDNARLAARLFSLRDAVKASIHPPVCLEKFEKGEFVRVRAHGGRWINGQVILASENGKSIAVTLEHFLQAGKGGLAHENLGPLAALLWTTEGWQNLDGVMCKVIHNNGLPN